jgi:hypothetical protein
LRSSDATASPRQECASGSGTTAGSPTSCRRSQRGRRRDRRGATRPARSSWSRRPCLRPTPPPGRSG